MGFKAILLTVDAPVLGRREMDMRSKAPVHADDDDEGMGAASGGVGGSLVGYFDLNLSWSDIAWLRVRVFPFKSLISGQLIFFRA